MNTSPPSKRKKLNGYQIFCSELSELHGKNYAIIGQKWRLLSQEEKQEYNLRAKEINDKEREAVEGVSMKLEDVFQKNPNSKPFDPFEYKPPVTISSKASKEESSNNISNDQVLIEDDLEMEEKEEKEENLTRRKRKTMDSPSDIGSPRKAKKTISVQPSQQNQQPQLPQLQTQSQQQIPTYPQTGRLSGGFSSFISQFRAPNSIQTITREDLKNPLNHTPVQYNKPLIQTEDKFDNLNEKTFSNSNMHYNNNQQEYSFDDFGDELDEILISVDAQPSSLYKIPESKVTDNTSLSSFTTNTPKSSINYVNNFNIDTPNKKTSEYIERNDSMNIQNDIQYPKQAINQRNSNSNTNTNNTNCNNNSNSKPLFDDPYLFKNTDKNSSWENFEIINLFAGVERFGDTLLDFESICISYSFKPFRRSIDLRTKYQEIRDIMNS